MTLQGPTTLVWSPPSAMARTGFSNLTSWGSAVAGQGDAQVMWLTNQTGGGNPALPNYQLTTVRWDAALQA